MSSLRQTAAIKRGTTTAVVTVGRSIIESRTAACQISNRYPANQIRGSEEIVRNIKNIFPYEFRCTFEYVPRAHREFDFRQ